MATKLLLVPWLALLSLAAAAQTPDSITCVTLTTTNGKSHLVQLVAENPYVYKVRFCNDPTGQVAEVPKAQVQVLGTSGINVPTPSQLFVTEQPKVPDEQPWTRQWRVALEAKLPLWGRYEGNLQLYLLPHLVVGLGLQNWSTKHAGLLDFDHLFARAQSNYGNRLLCFGRIYSNRSSGAYFSGGVLTGKHRLRRESSGLGFFGPIPIRISSAVVRVNGLETQVGFAKVFKNHLTLDVGASGTGLFEIKYLARVNGYTYHAQPFWVHLMLGVAF